MHVKQTPEDRLDAADRLVSGRLEDMLDWCVTPKKEERVKKEMKIQTEAPVVADQENKKPVQTRRKLKTGPSKAEIRRCARRGGVVRMSGTIYEETQNCLATFLRPILRDSVVYGMAKTHFSFTS